VATRVTRVLFRISVTVLILGAAFIGYCAFFRSMPRALPAPSGRYGVGRQEFTWRSATEGIGTEVAGSPETDDVAVCIWYPTEVGAPGMPAAYLSAVWQNALGTHATVPALLTQNYSVVRDHAIDGAPLAPDETEYPLVLLTAEPHIGAFSYSTFAEQMASDGFIVVGITVGGTSAVDFHPLAGSAFVLKEPGVTPSRHRLAARWARDIRFVLDMLRTMNIEESGVFASRIDFSRVALLGAGFGGVASIDAASLLTQSVPVVLLGGSVPPDEITPGRRGPLLVLGSGSPRMPTGGQTPGVTGIDDGIYAIRGSTPLSITDFPYLFCPTLRATGAIGTIEPGRMKTIVCDMVQTFLDSMWIDQVNYESLFGSVDAAAPRARYPGSEPPTLLPPPDGAAVLSAVAEAARQYPEVVR